ncbi:MAG: hypothetical protein H7329_11780 [Opitutaceae bacterium]|nr:hypothetical protein [Cytophagales bacterium]
MKNLSKLLISTLAILIAACSGLTNKSLEKGGDKDIRAKSVKPVEFIIENENVGASIDGKYYEPEKEDIANSLININKGVLESFNGDIDNWWTGEGGRFALEKQGGALKINAHKVGPKWDAFGRPYNNLDLTGGYALKVKARSEGEKSPVLRIDFKDANGYVSNGKPVTNRIVRGTDFTDYYFRFDHKLRQTFPDEKTLDAKAIKEILFFINGGGSSYTGTVFIDEIKVVPAAEAANAVVIKEVGSNGGFIDNFDEGTAAWWVSGNQKGDSPDGKSLRVSGTKVGPAYDAFGRSFDPINFNVASTIRVRAKVEGSEIPNVRLDIKDPNGFATNARPNIVKFDKGNEFVDYYFPFKGRFTQTWPNYKKVDATQIQELLFMVNAGKSPWTGKITIKEVEAIVPAPEENKAPTSASGKPVVESPSTLPGVVIDNFEEGVDSWWMGSDKYTLTSMNDKIMMIGCKEIGQDYETFGKGFGARDFTKTPILVIRAMVETVSSPPLVRVDVKDADGRVANVSPIMLTFKNDGVFTNYYYDYRGKFSQVYPDVQTMNPAQVQEVIIFINPGGPKINTAIYVEDIKALTPEEYEQAIKK